MNPLVFFLSMLLASVDCTVVQQVCKDSPIELGIVLDSTSSIGSREIYQKGLEFLQHFLSKFDIGREENQVRVSLIPFGDGIYKEGSFNLTTYQTKQEVIDAVRDQFWFTGLWTKTGEGIKYMATHQLDKAHTRENVARVGVVLTDGDSHDKNLTKVNSAAARKDGIIMIAIGVGRLIKEEELINIAGDPELVFRVNNYDELDNIKAQLINTTCTEVVQHPCPPAEDCCKNGKDLYFAFNRAELGVEGVSWAKDLISRTVENKELKGFRFGVQSCPADEDFDLDDHWTPTEIKARVNAYNTNHMTRLVDKLIKGCCGGLYSEVSGGRPEAPDVAVLVTGANDGKTAGSLEKDVARLIGKGVEVFIADPKDSGITIEGAITLRGKTAEQVSFDLATLLCPSKPDLTPIVV